MEDKWDFYPCQVDGAPASIFLNLWFEDTSPLSPADTLYRARIVMRDKAEHGMGSAEEAAVLHPFEDRLVSFAKQLSLFHVGRLRNHGAWDLVFYGPPGLLESFHALSHGIDGLDGRELEVGSKPDPSWECYRGFLLPDTERRQWMRNRSVVEALERAGDLAAVARRVDHWVYFSTKRSRASFARVAARAGFTVEDAINSPADEHGFGARVHRSDIVELAHIHSVVMHLVELAGQHQGDYDGWETSVEKTLR